MTAFVDVRRAVRAWAEERSSRRFTEVSEAERVNFELFERDVLVGTLVGRTGRHVTLAPGAATDWRWTATEVGRDVLGHAARSNRPRRPPLPPSLVESLAKGDSNAPSTSSPVEPSTPRPPAVATTRRAPAPVPTSIDDDPRSAFLRSSRRPSVLTDRAAPHAPLTKPETAERTSEASRAVPSNATAPEHGRMLLEHLRSHGSIQEADLIQLLGSARAVRKLSLQLDELGVSIESVSGVKIYRLRR
jgi:hypothetical protein